MKTILTLLFIPLLFFSYHLRAQDHTRLFRLYEDNDGMNIRGLSTDQAYTNGIRLDLFYTKDHRDRFFLDRIIPKAGDSSRNTYGWSVSQLMYTPDSLTEYDYRPHDYAYACALIASHSLYSYNPVKKYAILTEIIAGVRGPAAGGESSQRLIHKVFHFEKPHGWSHQLENKFLINVNVRLEKQLAQWGPYVELSGGTQLSAGTMFSGASLYPMLRVGKMKSYYNGYIQQYSDTRSPKTRRPRILQVYAVFRPEVQLVLNNALLDGRLQAEDPENEYHIVTLDRTSNTLNHMVYSLNYGGVMTFGAFGISYMQNTATALLKHGYSHEYGNVSFYFAFR